MVLFDPSTAGLLVGARMLLWKHSLCLLAVVLGSLTTTAQEVAPGLQWDETTIKMETGGTEAKNVTFRFRNTSDRPVTIRSINTSCGCTVGQPDKKVYAPGENGLLPVTHKPKPGPGVRAYRINVQTDEGGGREHILTLQVANNPRLTLQPRVINWAKDEPRVPKNIEVLLKTDDPLRVTGARAEPDVLDIAVNAGPVPGSQTLVVTPKPGPGAVPGRVRIQLLTEPPLPPSMDTQFYAVLR